MSLDSVKLHLVDDIESAWGLKRWLGERREVEEIGVDTETTGLSRDKDTVRTFQFGDLNHGWMVPANDWLGVAREVFRDYRGRFLTHNGPQFDYPMIRNTFPDLELPSPDRCDDTLVMSKVLEPHMSAALKMQSARYVDPAAAYMQGKLDEAISGRNAGWNWATVPITLPEYWQYGALDAVFTAHIAAHHRPLVRREAPRAYELELATQWVVERMERYGACVDVAFAQEKKDAFDRYVDEAAEWVHTHFGVRAGSNQEIIRVLESFGYEFSKPTKSGAKALDEDVLLGIDHPLAETVLRRRKLQKLSSTYLRHFIEECDENHLIHPSINTLGARTSRMSMSDPNLQNLPRSSENSPAANAIRDTIITRYWHRYVYANGGVERRQEPYDRLTHGALLMCDFDQIEMRIFAHLADDAGMREAFTSGGDFFVNLARQLFDDPTIEKGDPRRQLTKNTSYARQYGAGVRKMALTAGVSESSVRMVMSNLDRLYPGGVRFTKQLEQVAWERYNTEGQAYARSPLTNRRHVADDRKVYALLNYLIQGTAAEVLKMKILEADAAGIGEWLVVPVHDELIADVPPEHVEEVAHLLPKIMNDDRLFTVPITASVSYGQRWGSKKSWETSLGR